MHLYFSGIGGAGLSPLALLAKDCEFEVSGSDLSESLGTIEVAKKGIVVTIGQSLEEISTIHSKTPIDWVIITSALPPNHPHLIFAQENNIKTSKRHDLINLLIEKKQLKMIAVAGTHGKTTTTAMVVWLFKQLGIPVSYSIGSNITFGPSAQYQEGSEYFVYEADEFDRNFLNFKPYISLVASLDYDHGDTYPTQTEYVEAFQQFISQSEMVILWDHDARQLIPDLDYQNKDHGRTNLGINKYLLSLQNTKNYQFELCNSHNQTSGIALAGQHNRENGQLALQAVFKVISPITKKPGIKKLESKNDEELNNQCVQILNNFPGTQRRFEQLAPRIYSDYAHHPTEIAATLELAQEIVFKYNYQGICAVYQPHQNLRQHDEKIQVGYINCFERAKFVFWLPTYLSREPEGLEILTPEFLISQSLGNKIKENIYKLSKTEIKISELNDELTNNLAQLYSQNYLILAMGAGSIDNWLRTNLNQIIR